MHIPSLLLALAPLAFALSPSHTIYYKRFTDDITALPQPLLYLSLNTSSPLSQPLIHSYTPPLLHDTSKSHGDPSIPVLIKVGILDESKTKLRTSTLTTTAQLHAGPKMSLKINLRGVQDKSRTEPETVVGDIEIESVGLVLYTGYSVDGVFYGSSNETTYYALAPGVRDDGTFVGMPRVEVVGLSRTPRAVLARPMQLNKEGKVEAAPEEKTLFQRYWWVGVGVLLLLTLSPGEEPAGKKK